MEKKKPTCEDHELESLSRPVKVNEILDAYAIQTTEEGSRITHAHRVQKKGKRKLLHIGAPSFKTILFSNLVSDSIENGMQNGSVPILAINDDKYVNCKYRHFFT